LCDRRPTGTFRLDSRREILSQPPAFATQGAPFGPGRRAILAVSRLTGWVLAAAVLAGAVAVGLTVGDRAASRRVLAEHNKRDFVQKVIACRHKPGEPPRHSWPECERSVRAAE
jgi:hypothetical protein